VRITDTLNGHTVEDVRRNDDGSVTFYCDSGRYLTLEVLAGVIEAKPRKLVIPGQPELTDMASARMRLLDAFRGLMISHAYYDDSGSLIFVCEPCNTGGPMFEKSHGHREIKLTHSQGRIDELPPVSAIIKLPGLAVFGKRG
jgi:hypothetical protein